MKTHHLDAETVHHEWNNAIPPRLEIEPGDTVVFETRDAADRFYSKTSTKEDVLKRVFKGHPLTGPVKVKGAHVGDTLVVEVLDMIPALDFGWTQVRPGRGLLPEEDFPKPHLTIWDVSDKKVGRMPNRPIAVPLAPFPGVMGVALPEPGGHNTAPPRRNGGNMDIKQLHTGSTLYLPVLVDGALFSVGDGHGAQGDGEVCITAIETGLVGTFELHVRDDFTLEWPMAETANELITMGFDPDLDDAAVIALRNMIKLICARTGLSREDAYTLCSLAADLRVTQVVNGSKGIHVVIDKALLCAKASPH
jgi:acetamidase/formamidase